LDISWIVQIIYNTRGFDFSRADLVADSLGELVDLSKRATR